MTLIYLTREFVGNDLSFDGLPNLDDGFVRILVTARLIEGSGHDLQLYLNGAGPGHSYAAGAAQFQNTAPPAAGGNFIRLATIASEPRYEAHLSSDVVISLMPGNKCIMARGTSSSFSIGATGGAQQVASWLVSGTKPGATLTSVGFGIRRQNGSLTANVSGHARLFWHKHYQDLQAVI